MKISELLETRIPKKFFMPNAKEASQLPSAPSLNDEPSAVDGPGDAEVDDSEENQVDGNAVSSFKQDGISIGGGIFALSAWTYPDAWSGGGYSDTRMHTITTLARELGIDVGDYEYLNDQDMADGRRLEVVFFNEQTDTMFRLSASGDSGRIEFSPNLADLQRDGSITNAQMSAVKKIEGTVAAWVQSVPEDWMDEPRDRRWKAAERKVVGLFDFGGGDDFGDEPEKSDPNHPSFWDGLDTRSGGDEEADARYMEELRAKKRAEKAAKLAAKGN